MNYKTKELIRFDWAMKKLLRQNREDDLANFDILEGFLSELLSEDIKINQILDSESNKESEKDNRVACLHNRVDLLVENSKGELVIVEIQNSQEYDWATSRYFHRILYGASKIISEHIQRGEKYANVKKVISITIAYFELGQGKDYVYHGQTNFKGLHKGDILMLSDKQVALYQKETPSQIFPEYWLIKVGKFNNRVKDKLDEWIYFLKNGEVREDFTAKGLDEAKEKLNEMQLSDEDRKAYQRFLRQLHDIASEQYNRMLEEQFKIEDAVKKVKQEADEVIVKVKQEAEKEREDAVHKAKLEAEKEKEVALKNKNIETARILKKSGVSKEIIQNTTGLTFGEIEAI
jgi:predicted transposase/invertase (TIGR01784 family)